MPSFEPGRLNPINQRNFDALNLQDNLDSFISQEQLNPEAADPLTRGIKEYVMH